jgi:hypothetical protein
MFFKGAERTKSIFIIYVVKNSYSKKMGLENLTQQKSSHRTLHTYMSMEWSGRCNGASGKVGQCE